MNTSVGIRLSWARQYIREPRLMQDGLFGHGLGMVLAIPFVVVLETDIAVIDNFCASKYTSKHNEAESPVFMGGKGGLMSTIREVLVPEVGESIAGGQILTWFKQSQDLVKQGEPLFELETDKITLTVPAEYSGVLTVLVPAGTDVLVNQKVAMLEISQTGAMQASSTDSSRTVSTEAHSVPHVANKVVMDETQHTSTPVFGPEIPKHISPHRSELVTEAFETSGRVGRILKEDSILHLQHSPAAEQHVAQKTAMPASIPKPITVTNSAPQDTTSVPTQSRKRMSPIRKRIAERLVEAQHTAAMLTTFNEVDMSSAMQLRQQYQDAFSKKYGIKLGFMSFFVKAVVSALQSCPELNAFIDGDDIVYNHVYNVGIAVGTERGLVVPVVRNAEQLNFAEIELMIAQLAQKAKDKKLSLDDLSGGTFSITNGGIYGSLLSTPILNPPQSGILGMHGIKKRPVVVDDNIVIRPMMYLALSYDHRIVDGAEAVTFLRRVCDCIEHPERLLLGV